MFTQKQTKLFNKKASANVTKKPSVSVFVKAGLQENNVVLSGNGAKKYSTTGNALVDQFGQIGNFKAPRDFQAISNSCEAAWAEDPLNAVKFMLYLRTVTRKVQLFDGSKTQNPQLGAELKHESIMRMFWLSQKSEETFWANLPVFISLGSWKDVITMLQYDLVWHGWSNRILNWNKVGDLILSGLSNKNTCELLKKYLPQIKSREKCNTVEAQADTMIGKWICSLVFGPKENSYNYKQYRLLKTSGTAHEWQKLISQKQFLEH
jgi:hypothetical protein